MEVAEFKKKLSYLSTSLGDILDVPVYGYIKLDKTTACSFDDNLAIQIKVPVGVKSLVHGRQFLELVETLPDVPKISAKEGSVGLELGKTKMRLTSMPVEDFKFKMPTDFKKVVGTVNITDDLISAINHAVKTTIRQQRKPVYAGVTADFAAGLLDSTTGVVLTEIDIGEDKKYKGGACILHGDFCKAIISAWKDFSESDAKLHIFEDCQVANFADECIIFCKAIQGDPPNFSNIIDPAIDSVNDDNKFPVSNELIAAVHRAAIVSKGNVVDKTVLGVKENMVTLKTVSVDSASEEEIEVDRPSDEEFRVNLIASEVLPYIKAAAEVCLLEDKLILLRDNRTIIIGCTPAQ